MKIGYARVSTQEQNLDMQRRALRRAGCGRIFEDRISGASVKRLGLERALKKLKHGDELIVWKLDRLGRSLPHLISVMCELMDRGIKFNSLSENIDTGTAGGRLIFHLMGALAEFERALISERTREGLAAARLRGVKIGRLRVMDATLISRAQIYINAGQSPATVAHLLGIGRSTLYRALLSSSGITRQPTKSKHSK